jgi:hypothetical protein
MSAAPTPYARQANFTSFEQSNPTTPKPGSSLDGEFNAVLASLNTTITRLSEIQREDGRLRNGIVDPDCLSSDVLTLIGSDINPRGDWTTATVYSVRDLVSEGGISYIAVVEHVAGTFATDLAAGKWQGLSSSAEAVDIPFAPTGGLTSTDVQNALTELAGITDNRQTLNANLTALSGLTLAANKLPYATGAGALALADLTSKGRELLALATVAAMRTFLELGSAALAATGTTNGTVPTIGAGDKLAAALLPEVTAAMLAGTLDLSSKTLTLPTAAKQVRQVVNTQTGAVATGSTVIPFDDTIPQNTEGDQYMSLAITPASAASTLKIEVVFNYACSALAQIVVALFQDSTAGALAAMTGGRIEAAGVQDQVVFTHYMPAGTTSATTFKVRAGPSTVTLTFNGSAGARRFGGVMASSITITEYAA